MFSDPILRYWVVLINTSVILNQDFLNFIEDVPIILCVFFANIDNSYLPDKLGFDQGFDIPGICDSR